MATAEVIRDEPVQPPVKEVVLRLTALEAETLFRTLAEFTGRYDSRGRVATDIRNALYAHSTGAPGRFTLS